MRLGVYRATVTRVAGGRPYVVVPRLTGPRYEYGPLDVLESVHTGGYQTVEVELEVSHGHVVQPATVASHGTHIHPASSSTEEQVSDPTPLEEDFAAHDHDVTVGDSPELDHDPHVHELEETGVDLSHSHDVASRPLAKGDRVLVAFIEGRQDDPVVLGRLM